MRNYNNNFNWLLFTGILLVSSNLRAPITSLGVAVPSIKDTLGITNSEVSLITIVPLLSFALVSLFASKTSNKFGLEQTIFVALILILSGVLIRIIPDLPSLYIGTILVGIGVAFGNVITPSIIKANFHLHIGVVTAYYTVVMNTFGGISSYITDPLIKISSYNYALSFVGILTIFTLFLWSFQITKKKETAESLRDNNMNVWKSPLAWQITLFMGGQSLIFYSLIIWLPEYLSTQGYSIHTAGIYLFVLQISMIPFTFITPIIANKIKSQFKLTLVTGVLFIIGVTMMLIFPNWALISTIIIGISNGSAFGLVNTFFSLRTESSITSAKLSGMSQSIGYLLAAIGPLLFGVLHDITNGWTIPLMILLMTAVIITIFGSPSGNNKTIEETLLKNK